MKKINFLGNKFFAKTLLAVSFFFGVAGMSLAFNPITTQLDPGVTGQEVTNLQTFLAANPAIYPEGLVTGYYGDLTTAAVNRFQATYGLDQVGRVGPLTIAQINSLMAGGTWGNGTADNDTSAPVLYSMSSSIVSTSATFSWVTNENSTSKIYYGTSPIIINEGNINSVGFGATNGYVSMGSNTLSTSQQVTIGGLLPNTLYYYVLVSTDTYGNVSVAAVNNTFVTTNY